MYAILLWIDVFRFVGYVDERVHTTTDSAVVLAVHGGLHT